MSTDAFMMRCGESTLGTGHEFIEWHPTDVDRRRADRNHSQTLERLNQRGGMSWCEMAAILEDRAWHKMDQAAARTAVYAELERRVQTQPATAALSEVILAWQRKYGNTGLGMIQRDTLARAILDAGYVIQKAQSE